ncbi:MULTISPECIES: hypothetical protein [Paenibacillus]|nr:MULTISPECIES: hypothetical protein [Paenibacillus]
MTSSATGKNKVFLFQGDSITDGNACGLLAVGRRPSDTFRS